MATLAALVKISLKEMFPNSLGFNVRTLIYWELFACSLCRTARMLQHVQFLRAGCWLGGIKVWSRRMCYFDS